MKHFSVSGMNCAACSARVESAVRDLEGVTACSVSLLTKSMTVEGSAETADIVRAVENAGYGAQCTDAGNAAVSSSMPDLQDTETPLLLRKLLVSLVFLLALMYLSMGHNMFGWPLPAFLQENPCAVGLSELLLCEIVMLIHRRFFISGLRGLFHRAPNMDTLVGLGSAVSFLYSTVLLYRVSMAQSIGNLVLAKEILHACYFESAAMILVLITVGKTLEAYSKGKTTDALASLIRLSPKTARLWKNGQETEISAESIHIGDCFLLKPGDSIPADGIVLEGESTVDESSLTGESMPVEKYSGCNVSAATVNGHGRLICRAIKVGSDTTHARMISLMSDAAASKAPIARMADRVAGVFVPAVMALSAITLIVWLLLGSNTGEALERAISVLVVSCPCALGLATPVAIMVGNGVGARHGILFKTAEAMENLGKVKIIVLDKTGTITSGKPVATQLIAEEGVSVQELLTVAASLESASEHPIAKAILQKAQETELSLRSVEKFQAHTGFGVTAFLNGEAAFAGNQRFAEQYFAISQKAVETSLRLSRDGATVLFVGTEKKLLGLIAVEDIARPDSADAISQMKALGIHTVMLSGDKKETALSVANHVGIQEVISQVLPDEKESVIRRLRKEGLTVMVGDGLNDAPALASADIGCAIGCGTNVAIDAAQVVLMNSRLSDVCAAVRLSRATLRIIRQNLFWALCYNLFGIPLAAGVFIPVFGWQLTPMFGAAMMSVSSFLVVSNALRLNLFHPFETRQDHPLRSHFHKNHHQKELKSMEKIMKIEGMMCHHCEAHVQKALEAVPGVTGAVCDHVKGTATVTLSSPVSDEVLKQAVEKEGYQVL